MMKNAIDTKLAIQSLKSRLSETSKQFYQWEMSGDDWYDPSWLIESSFLQLLAIAETLGLVEFRKTAYKEFIAIKNSKYGFVESGTNQEGDPHSVVIGRMNCYLRALENLFPGDKQTTVTKDLLQIIRDIHYVITDTNVFQTTPENENDVHLRIEAVLKCVFPDLKHKPVLTKQIKNFEPDTGIPSLCTLMEYKFLSRKADIGVIADQLLADTRGYISKDWKRFIFVIYETNRFRPENDWNLFLREAEVSSNTTVVVLSGEPSVTMKAASKGKSKKKIHKLHSGEGREARRR